MKETKTAMMDVYFMDARSKLIDIAAFMDRAERYGETGDYRYQEFVKALDALRSSDRAESVLMKLSDPSKEPSEKASAGPAVGAYQKD
ncbi:hypothetical protein DDZ13_11825 [Coraliomargarita sinensis]|uniref:Uncharacterized protein n=1 Tax=Coraliomargarita sinensis TaxID=2174842 RepID=A0A317ZHC7_9BACT|nr:hypothetical protein [Coraliomargarita sinensis]PXA03378.1 hypothetical protein DDZ13_11825 [Coraliomargarita sinensis]